MVFILDDANQEVQITTSGTSARVALDELSDYNDKPGRKMQVQIYASEDAVVKFGDSTVTAVATVTSSRLAAGNIYIPKGAILLFELGKGQYTDVAAIQVSTAGIVCLRFGYGEQ